MLSASLYQPIRHLPGLPREGLPAWPLHLEQAHVSLATRKPLEVWGRLGPRTAGSPQLRAAGVGSTNRETSGDLSCAKKSDVGPSVPRAGMRGPSAVSSGGCCSAWRSRLLPGLAHLDAHTRLFELAPAPPGASLRGHPEPCCDGIMGDTFPCNSPTSQRLRKQERRGPTWLLHRHPRPGPATPPPCHPPLPRRHHS